MRHIWHLEEFFTGKVSLGEADFVQRYFAGQIPDGRINADGSPKTIVHFGYSIKFDGSPAVVFGFHDGKPFVSTKSYFNKQPIYATSIDEIHAEDWPQRVKDILTDLFVNFNWSIKETGAASGTRCWIADVLEAKSDERWQSNAIAYNCDSWPKNMKTGYPYLYMVHTFSFIKEGRPQMSPSNGSIPIHDTFIFVKPVSTWIKLYIDYTNDTRAIISILCDNPRLGKAAWNAISNIDVAVLITAEQVGRFKDNMRVALSTNYLNLEKKFKTRKKKDFLYEEYLSDDDILQKLEASYSYDHYIAFLLKLKRYKLGLLKTLNRYALSENGIQCSIKRKSTNTWESVPHEGFVINIPNTYNTRVKFVDTAAFTKMNNDDDIYKPWRDD
jgi:hypothetical protein